MTTYHFTDDTHLTEREKWLVLHHWGVFILNGFERQKFTPELYHFLTQHCGFIAHHHLDGFWNHYFNGDLATLRRFLNQFGGNRLNAEAGHTVWLSAPASDLKVALCREMEKVYSAMLQVLSDLEANQQELVQVWFDFAAGAGLQIRPSAPGYKVTPNTRVLLAYTAEIALGHQRSTPPASLPPSLLQPHYIVPAA